MPLRSQQRRPPGRPAGKPNLATPEELDEFSHLAKRHATKALNVLLAIMEQGERDADRISAANAILDRALGRPRQAIDHSGEIKGGGVLAVPVPLDAAQWAAVAAAQQAALAARPPSVTPTGA